MLVVGEVIESGPHLRDVLVAIGADEHLLVRLQAPTPTLRERIVAREPAGWSGLEHLLGEIEPLDRALDGLAGVHLTLDTVELGPAQVAERIRAARPDLLLSAR